jgi:hypothetical protein
MKQHSESKSMHKPEILNYGRSGQPPSYTNRRRPAFLIVFGLSAFNILVMLLALFSPPKVGELVFGVGDEVNILIGPILIIALPIVWWIYGRASLALYLGAAIFFPFVWMMVQNSIFDNVFHVRK